MLRIVTYNTHGSQGMDGVRSTSRIAETLRPLSADVLCFQELYQTLPPVTTEDQPHRLGQLLNRTMVFQRCKNFVIGGYGIGIAVRGRIIEVNEHLLPAYGEQRGALEVRLRDIAGLRRLTVFCTHWGLDAEERMQQAEMLAELVRHAPRPVIVCGDLNEEADGNALALLKTNAHLEDADREKNNATFVSSNPTVRLDYILYSTDLHATAVDAAPSLASDHLPVIADLEPRLDVST